MYSTPEERNPYYQSRSHHTDVYATRPTIEQIAMGLHISRTPHLRQSAGPHQRYSVPSLPTNHHKSTNYIPHVPTSRRYDSSCPPSPRRSLPPPPPRSSLKKVGTDVSLHAPATSPGLPAASLSTSTVASIGPATPESARSVLSFRVRMSRFLPSLRSSSSVASPASSVSEGVRPLTPKKAVRFSTSVLDLDASLPHA
ncbi:hypothetical protein SERLA73DRAFT_184802 [Serpula lacrymans var. lacrymans S7.3]|uniref:Uncharacterized protein n=2 Tax=Serpula lacrymans var. lacrymans TaxID=341189 RepID=F8Q548_SERL3|nr:uncharacterized protein SERLADRAFT_472931 [Serpula lacrymans var. lacrymans S7.9]EGN96675.1 hypothetical protein SERLA73DRAFT_184802 [Serpula lacrymans var. lacrymans S7.3]EGO22293.1 hypothetical protein SERLADRAFT_472931 [Serpula lacrymans var. lacrymans S7.9]